MLFFGQKLDQIQLDFCILKKLGKLENNLACVPKTEVTKSSC
jgi:hypothetical protein